MKTLFQRIGLAWLVALLTGLGFNLASAATVIIGDQYDVANAGSGFALGSGANSGITPPTTRLTGSQAANLRYLKLAGTKFDSLHYITNGSQLGVGFTNNTGASSTLTLSAGTGAFDFGPALNTAAETPATPGMYDLTINIANGTAVGSTRCSFAFSSAAGVNTAWDFGIQLYHANAGDSFYTLQKRIRKVAAGTGSDINTVIGTVGMYPNEVAFLIRVTDAGMESGANYHSRVQVSVDGGNTWIYDTQGDADLPNGIRFSSLNRYVAWDIAGGTGPVTYDMR